MLQILRIIVASGVFGWLCWYLGKTLVNGLRTGMIHHTNSIKICRKKENLVGFWALVVLFSGFVIMLACGWFFVVLDAIGKMK